MKNTKPIYIIGHRNPDTDSICSAIGYAHLKQALGVDTVEVPGYGSFFGFPLEDYKPWTTPWGQSVLVPGKFNTTVDANGDTLTISSVTNGEHGTVTLVVFLLANTFVVVKREGLSLSHLLPGLLALCIVMACVGGPVLLFVQAPPIVLALALLVLMVGIMNR